MGARRIDLTKRFADLKKYYDSPLYKRSLAGRSASLEQLLGLSDGEELVVEEMAETSHGTEKVKFQERYKGIPIIDEAVVVEEDRKGEFTDSLQGKLVEGVGQDLPDTRPSISAQDALEIAVRQAHDNMQNVKFDEAVDSKLQIYMKPGDDGDSSKLIPVLVYVLSYLVENDSKTSRPFYIINAKTGEVVTHWQGMDTRFKPRKQEIKGFGGNTKTGRYIYGKDFGPLNTTQTGENACTYDFGNVRVVHVHGKKEGNESFVVDCKEGAKDAANGAFSPANDALYFAQLVNSMYTTQYGVEPLKGEKIVVNVHYGIDYDNAFWDGKRIAFGDGNNNSFPLVSLDIVGHEVSHGFTEKHSHLIYKAQSGGINEAFSDMSGEAAEVFSGRKVDWVNGEDIIKGKIGLRWLNNPNRDNKSVEHLECFYPAMDVHYSSGIFNKAFYLLSNTSSWSIKKAFGVFVRANQLYWTENSTFAAAACGAVVAARDMGLSTRDVERAFQAVGVIPCKETPDVWQKLWTKIEDIQGQRSFVWSVPDDTRDLKLQVTGQADLYVKVGDVASADNYDHKASGENPTISVASPKDGVWYILVRGGSSVSHTLRGTFDGPLSGAPLLKIEKEIPDSDEDNTEDDSGDYPDENEDKKGNYTHGGSKDIQDILNQTSNENGTEDSGSGESGGDGEDEGRRPPNQHNVYYGLHLKNVSVSMMTVEVSPKSTNKDSDAGYLVKVHPVNITEVDNVFGVFQASGVGYTILKSCYLEATNYVIRLFIFGPYNAEDWDVKVKYITKILPLG